MGHGPGRLHAGAGHPRLDLPEGRRDVRHAGQPQVAAEAQGVGGQGLPRQGRRVQRAQRLRRRDRVRQGQGRVPARRQLERRDRRRTGSATTRSSSTCRRATAARRSAIGSASFPMPHLGEDEAARTSRRRTSTASPARRRARRSSTRSRCRRRPTRPPSRATRSARRSRTGWDKLVKDGGLTLYPDWSSPTMLADDGPDLPGDAGRPDRRPQDVISQAPQNGLGGRTTRSSRAARWLSRCNHAGCRERATRREVLRVRARAPGRAAARGLPVPGARVRSSTCCSRSAPLLYTAWLSFFDWDGLTVGTWVGLDNYKKVLSDPAIRASFVHSFELIFFYAVLPVLPRAGARVADRAQPRARRHVLPRRAVPAADDRDGRRRDRVGVDLRAGRAAQRGAAGDRARAASRAAGSATSRSRCPRSAWSARG